MRKRYSRSYTVLSFLTMFSYREQPSGDAFLIKIKDFNQEIVLHKLRPLPLLTGGAAFSCHHPAALRIFW